MEMILTAVLLFVLANLIMGAILSFKVRKLYSYPGVFGYPVIGSIYYFYRILFSLTVEDTRKYLVQIAKQHKEKGICFHYGYGFKALTLVSSPELIKQLAFHPNLKDKALLYGGVQSFMVGPFSNVFTDDSWKVMRKDYNSLLKKSNIDNNYYNIFLKSADKMVELMLASRHSFHIDKTCLSVVLSVNIEALFDVESSLAFNRHIVHNMILLKDAAGIFLANRILSKTILTIFTPIDEMYVRKVGTLRRTVLRKIYKKINNSNQCYSSETTDSYQSLPMCIASRTEKNKEFEVKVIREINEGLIASTHTIGATLISAISILAVLPEIQEKAWKEQYEIFGDDTREPTLQDLEEMTYLERFFKETLRFGGPPYIGKQTTEDIEIDGIIIPKDTTVVYLLNYMCHDPNHWKNPEIFDPDRFLEEKEGLKHLYAPFGVGVRRCPGGVYAMTLMKILASKVLRKTIFSPVNKTLKFSDLIFEGHILMEMLNPPSLRVKERV